MRYSFEDSRDLTHISDGWLFSGLSSDPVQDSDGTGLVDSIISAFVIVLGVIVVIFFGVAAVSPILLIFWLALSICMIATGRPNKNRVNAERTVGAWLIVTPIALVVEVMFLSGFLGYPPVILIALLITMVLTFVGVVYTVNNLAKFTVIPLVAIAIVLPALALASLLGVYY